MNGPHSVSSAAHASWSSSSASVIRSPAARLPIWSWFWLHTTRRQVGIAAVSIGHAVVAVPERRERPVVEEAALAHLRQRAQRLEVRVVAVRLPGECHVQSVMEVVAPLRVQTVATGLAGRDQPRVVEVGLGDQGQRPTLVGRQRRHLDRHLLEQVCRRLVGQSVHGVQPQPVDVVVLEPHPDVVEDVATHLRRPLAVEVHQVAPGVASVLEVGTESRQVVTRRPEVVVDDVLDDAEASSVAAVDEALVRRRPAVRLVHREPRHPVVAPVVGAVEGVDRHQLDEVDADALEVVEPRECRVERALRPERADVQLVDHRPGKLPPGPRAVGPVEVGRVEGHASAHAPRRADGATADRAGRRPRRRAGSRRRRPARPPPTPSTSRRRRAPSRASSSPTDSRTRDAVGAQTWNVSRLTVLRTRRATG